MKLKILIVIALVLIVILTITDLDALKYGVECFKRLLEKQSVISIYQLCFINFTFKIVGIIFFVIGIIELFKKDTKANYRIIILFSYVIIALVLLLPIYHKDGSFDGIHKHTHSFWEGKWHFH